ncbi:MAG: TolB family protein, partial [Bacteroidota bacterium]
MASCRFAEQAMANPVKFDPKNMGPGINSSDLEYFPAITADGSTFLFTRRPVNVSPGQQSADQEDFYVSTRSGEIWQAAMPVAEINTLANEGAPSLSADGQYLFFTACEERFKESARKTNGSCDIFITKKVGEKYGVARNLEAPVNTGIWESQPSFSSDGRTLYFVRAIKGSDGRTQQDIYVTRINDNSSWSEPIPLASNINTPYNESSVFIHPDDQTMYFSSDGHPGLGGLDIFVCRKLPTGEWGQPINLGYPINTNADENSLLVSPDGTTGFFASDRTGGYGGLDIYKFELDEALRPLLVTYMKGKVYDAETKQPLSASFTLIDLEKDTPVVRSSSNALTGGYLVCLPTG